MGGENAENTTHRRLLCAPAKQLLKHKCNRWAGVTCHCLAPREDQPDPISDKQAIHGTGSCP